MSHSVNESEGNVIYYLQYPESEITLSLSGKKIKGLKVLFFFGGLFEPSPDYNIPRKFTEAQAP